MFDYVLKTSLSDKRAVTIVYQKGNEITQRKVRVTSIKENEIIAYCYLRHEYRHFKKNNILAATCTH
jgi:predicted DNA-binding transcriptional regulator YafY